ncbi:unnamed protein product, partial [Ectocarpus fasciculatus]
VINLLAKALSPDPTKRPPMTEMLTDLDEMNERLLEIETQGVISAATATAAVAGGRSSRTASTGAGEGGVADGLVAPQPPPPTPVLATLEVLSGAFEGGRSAVPDQAASAAGENIIPAIIPAVAVGPVISRETADGSAAAEVEGGGGGGGRSALAPSAAPATDVQRSTASRPLQGGSVPVSGVASGGMPSHDGRSGGGAPVPPVTSTASVVQRGAVTGGSAAVMPGSAGAGGGVAVTAAVGEGKRAVDSQ